MKGNTMNDNDTPDPTDSDTEGHAIKRSTV